MKIYNKKDFLKLDTCLFCSGSEWVFHSICLKADTLTDNEGIGVDFYYLPLCDINANDSNELFDSYEEMLQQGMSKKMNEHLHRDGRFDDNDIFLVFEIMDLCQLHKYIKTLLNFSSQKFEYFLKSSEEA